MNNESKAMRAVRTALSPEEWRWTEKVAHRARERHGRCHNCGAPTSDHVNCPVCGKEVAK